MNFTFGSEMKTLFTSFASLLMLSLASGCVGAAEESIPGAFRTSFDGLAGWRDDSRGNSPRSYSLTNGLLRISTRAQTRDGVKIRTFSRFGAGRYSWRVFVPAMGEGDQTSIGAFLYRDDKHEVDFEIGYGRAKLRKQLDAKETDLVCYCTSQGHPYSSSQLLIKRDAWYVLSIDLTCGEDGNYLITWLVDGKQVKQLQSTFGNEVTFTAHCSVENLLFIGDHIPTQENYGLFDSFGFVPSIRKSGRANKAIDSDNK